MRFLTEADLVVGTATGDILGVDASDDLAGVSIDRLRLVDGVIVDVSERTNWFVDRLGRLHVEDAPGRAPIVCSLNAQLVRTNDAWSVRDPKEALKAHAADARWRYEQAGTLWDGWPVNTDAVSQSKYLSELQAIALGIRDDSDPWKFRDGQFRSVSNAQFPALAIAAREHVRTAFGMEGAILAQIEAGAVTTPAQIDAAFGV